MGSNQGITSLCSIEEFTDLLVKKLAVDEAVVPNYVRNGTGWYTKYNKRLNYTLFEAITASEGFPHPCWKEIVQDNQRFKQDKKDFKKEHGFELNISPMCT
jgi:hypothetical protein